MKLYSIRTVATTAVLMLVAGIGAGRVSMRKQADREIESASLAHQLEVTGFCANALALVDSTEEAELSVLLEDRLKSAVVQASSLADGGARLGIPAPNLWESARRAAAYYERRHETERQRMADRLVQVLAEAR